MPYDPSKHHRRSIRLKGYDYRKEGAYFVTICVEGHVCRFGTVQSGRVRLSPEGRVARDCWLALPDHFDRAVLDAFVVMPNHVHGIVFLMGPPPTDGPSHDDDAGTDGGRNADAPSHTNDDTGTNGGRNADAPSHTNDDTGTNAGRNDVAPSHTDDDTGTNGGRNADAPSHTNDDIGMNVGARHAVPLPGTPRTPWPPSDAAPAPGIERFGRPVPGSLPTLVRSYKSAVTKRINAMMGTPGARLWQHNYYEHVIRTDDALRRIRWYIAQNPARWRQDRFYLTPRS